MTLKRVLIALIICLFPFYLEGDEKFEDNLIFTGKDTFKKSMTIYYEEEKVNQIEKDFSYDTETARIMVDMARQENAINNLMSFIEELINLDKKKAVKLLIKYKISYTYENGKIIGYKEKP